MLSGVTLTAGGLLTAVAALFAYGEQGGWWDPSDFSTMFQDSAGTIPVTAVGQPVGRINDKSGRGNHRTQATAASRPILRQDASGYYYLEFDGVDDSMATGSVDFSATDKMTVWAGVNKQSDAATAMLAELSANADGNAGSFSIFAPLNTGASGDFAAKSVGSIAPVGAATSPSTVAPVSRVFTVAMNIAADSVTLRLNGADSGSSSADQGTGNFGNYPLYIGRRGGSSLPFNGREYQTIIRGAATSDSQIARVERFVASRMGVSL